MEGQIIRGSCTGSPPCARGIESALATLRTLDAARESRPSGQEEGSTAYEDAFDAAMDDVRTRLSAALRLPDGSGVILCGGTDVGYSLAIAQTCTCRRRSARSSSPRASPAQADQRVCGQARIVVPLAGRRRHAEREVGSR